MRRRVVLGLMAAGTVLAVALLAAPEERRPVAVVGHTGVSVTSPTTTETAVATTSTTGKARAVVAATRSTTVVRSDAGGITVVNEGSAVASTGGNTVIGPPDATVVNGAVSAVGNSSEVRVSRP